MSVFSTNQNRQFYVINKVVTDLTKPTTGDVQVKVIDNGIDKELYFMVMGADTVLKSDRIPLKNLSYAKAVPASDMVTSLKCVKVSLNADVNNGAPVIGQDYILRINFRQFYGMSDQDQYFKDVAVRATSSTTATATDFYEKMVEALNLSFSREVGATRNSNPYLSFDCDEDGIYITEKEQSWTLGTEAQERVYFEVVPTTIYVDGVDEIWGTLEDKTASKDTAELGTSAYGNGKKIAGLEWFCMGERGDQYRQIGWPNNIDTKYLVDPSKQYDVLELHYAFTDDGINSYRSEKDITFVAVSDDATGQSTAATTGIDALVSAINKATGLQLKGIDGAVPTSDTSEGKAVVDDTEAGVATTEETGEEKAVVDSTDEAVATAETTEEKDVVDGAEETTETAETVEGTETSEGTETITA